MVMVAQLLILGAFAGFMAGLLGVGGGLIIVPILLYFLVAEVAEVVLMHTVIGTTLAVIIFTSISSIVAHYKHGAIHWNNFNKLTPTILLGAFSGALVAKYLSFDFLKIFFACFELLVSLLMWCSITGKAQANNLKLWLFAVVGYIIGFVSAIVGIGGGTMTTPFLVYNNVAIKNAIATSAAVGFPIAVAGSLGFIITGLSADVASSNLGFIHIKSFFIIVFASVMCAPLGAKVTHIIDANKLKKLFAIFLAFLAFMVFIF